MLKSSAAALLLPPGFISYNSYVSLDSLISAGQADVTAFAWPSRTYRPRPDAPCGTPQNWRWWLIISTWFQWLLAPVFFGMYLPVFALCNRRKFTRTARRAMVSMLAACMLQIAVFHRGGRLLISCGVTATRLPRVMHVVCPMACPGTSIWTRP